MKKLTFTTFLLLCAVMISSGQWTNANRGRGIIHVPADYPTIQQGIEAATAYDTVLVADGLYYENINFLGKKPLMVASEFLLDGDTNHIINTIINGSQPVDPDIGSVVTFGTGEDTTSVLCGFTITGGTGTIEPTVNMRMGGGMHIKFSGGKFLNNYIHDNAVNYNGGIYGGGMQFGGPDVTEIPWIVLRGNRIYDNEAISTSGASDGGGFICFYNLIMENNMISGNICSGHVGGSGGGVSISASFGPISLTIKDNYIGYNKSITDMGTNAYAALGGGLGIYFECSGTISDNVIEFNEIEAPGPYYSWGAGVFIQDIGSDDFIFENNIVNDNNCNNSICRGGGVSVLRAGGFYQNNIVINNTGTLGGGFHFSDSQTPIKTGTLINNTIVGNHSANGGGLYSYFSNVNIINSILWGNLATSSGISIYNYSPSSNTQVRYSDVENISIWPGEGNINADPGFLDYSCNIYQDSPCEDAGVASIIIGPFEYLAPLIDFEGTLRPWHLGFDIGAHECDIIDKLPDGDKSDKDLSSFTAYPNPTNGKIQITSTKTQTNIKNQISNETIEIVDLTGNVVATFNQEPGTRNQELDISDLPSGIYFVRMTVGGQRSAVSGKLVKL